MVNETDWLLNLGSGPTMEEKPEHFYENDFTAAKDCVKGCSQKGLLKNGIKLQ